ncbi:MAG: tRNA dihydrouridine synthase DusB [Thiotrichales bacterium]|nr:tRNA dihydrouridine synthase DusB [Thiotrichales bacterium]
MQIGPYRVHNQLLLAPMAGVTDRPFRQLCRKLGAGLAVSEMMSANPDLWHTRKSRLRRDHSGEPGPIMVQIAGSQPAELAQAAQFNVDQGGQIIDINMGCPKKKVCKRDAGSALLGDEKRVAEILRAVVAAVTVPVTLKIRTGWDRQSNNALTIARIAEDSGIQALTVHGRSRACGFSGNAEYATVAAVKSTLTIPVIANGDIRTAGCARDVLNTTGVDALMIGRAAQGNPWIFRQIDHYLRNGKQISSPTCNEIKIVMREHLQNLYSFYGEFTGVRVARKHISWYLKNLNGAESFRTVINRAEEPSDQLKLIDEFFSQKIEQQAA